MKHRAPIVLVTLMLVTVGALLFGWKRHQANEALRQRNSAARAEQERIGLQPDADQSGRTTKRIREISTSGGAATLDEALEMFRDYGKIFVGNIPIEEKRQQSRKMNSCLRKLSVAQVRAFINEVQGGQTTPVNRSHMLTALGMACQAALDQHRIEGLNLCLEFARPVAFPEIDQFQRSMNAAIQKWTREPDHQDVIEWVIRNIPTKGELIDEITRESLFTAILIRDRKEALALVDVLEIESATCVQQVIQLAKSPDDRKAALSDAKKYFATIPDDEEQVHVAGMVYETIGRCVAKDGFEAGRAWVDSAALTQNQKRAMGRGIGSHIREGEHSAWLTWFIQEIKSDSYQVPVQNIMIAWSKSDYQAAGKWFHSQPASPAKDFAVSVYADTISEFEPEAAVQWASTLPEGDLREKTLHCISHNWPRKSPEQKAAAEAFEKQLGIKHDK